MEVYSGEIIDFGPFRLDPGARRLEREGEPVQIGARALDILLVLVGAAGKVVGKAELMSAVWPDTSVVEGALRTHVYNLRKVLGDGVDGARYITSVAGRGYCFVVPVVRGSIAEKIPLGRTVVHSLPPRLSRITGRDETVRAIAADLREHRLVTILGAGGIGKTTVAVAVGNALLDEFAGAVHLIELGSLAEPTLVAPTVAATLGIAIQSHDVVERLRSAVQDQHVLFIFDNCEHVVAAAARLVEALLTNASHVHVLATSREALRIEGEHVHHLGPLETPPEEFGMTAEALQAVPAAQVFLERAAASGWVGQLTDADVPIVAETCRRLDGVALAIELAASFVGQCGIDGMATVLDDRLRVLRQRGRRTAPPRQQTLHALVAWSYDRLPEHERVVLRRLSVFVGVFSPDAAKAIALNGVEAANGLQESMTELVSKSLVSATVQDGALVYRLLETTRAYALEQLRESGELEHVCRLHAEFVAELLERTHDAPGRQRAELANVRTALEWSCASPSRLAVCARLAAAAAPMLLDLGLLVECHRWCSHALTGMGELDYLVELRLREGLALSTLWRGYTDGVRPAFERALELAHQLDRGDHEVRLLEHLNFLLQRSGNLKGALEVATRSVEAARTTTTMATAEWMVARSHYMLGDQTAALDHCEAGFRLAEQSG
jgi:predicted ATPase/DNA-binding winged helix-turn-helix (wHTH) protein